MSDHDGQQVKDMNVEEFEKYMYEYEASLYFSGIPGRVALGLIISEREYFKECVEEREFICE